MKNKKNRKHKLPVWVEKWLIPTLLDLLAGLVTAFLIKLFGLN